jgi:transposase-like protein
LERLNKEIRHSTEVVGIFSHHSAIVRLFGEVLAEQPGEWAISKTLPEYVRR